MKRTFACVAWIGLALAGGATADESGPYVSAGLGRIDAPDRAHLGQLTGDTENDEWSWNVGAGYRFNRNIAIELGYVDLGEVEADLTDPAGAADSNAHASFGAKGATLALVGSFPIGRWEPYLKAGVLFADTELQFAGSIASTPFSGRLTNESEDPLYGTGLRFTVTEPLQLYIDVTYFDDVGEHDTGRSSYFNATAGVLWRF